MKENVAKAKDSPLPPCRKSKGGRKLVVTTLSLKQLLANPAGMEKTLDTFFSIKGKGK